MSVTYTKLFSSITESTIWCEPAETKVVWITMLAKCDRYGRVFTSIPGLAKLAGVSVKSTREAINTFLEPDPDSRTKDHEGRRICEIDGGYGLLNHDKYRELRDEADRKAYKANWIAEKRAKDRKSVDSPVDNVDESRPQSTYTDADTDADTVKSKPLSSKDRSTMGGQAIDYLNAKAGRSFKPAKSNLAFLNARFDEGHTIDDVFAVIDDKCKEWLGTNQEQYLRPATLFNAEKFNQYIGQVGMEKSNGKARQPNQPAKSRAKQVSDTLDGLMREAIDRGDY